MHYEIGDHVQCRDRTGRVDGIYGTTLWVEFDPGGGLYPWRADQVRLAWRPPADLGPRNEGRLGRQTRRYLRAGDVEALRRVRSGEVSS